MKKPTDKERKAHEIAIEAALAETRADIAAGRVIKGAAAEHVKRVKKSALAGMGEEKGDILRGAPEGD